MTFELNKHALSLSPARQDGETQEQYKLRRSNLNKLSEAHAKGYGRVLYVSTKGGHAAVNADKRGAS